MFNELIIKNNNNNLIKDILKNKKNNKKKSNNLTKTSSLILVQKPKEIEKKFFKKGKVNNALVTNYPKEKRKKKIEKIEIQSNEIIYSLKKQIDKLKNYQSGFISKKDTPSLEKEINKKIIIKNHENAKKAKKNSFYVPIETNINQNFFYTYQLKENENNFHYEISNTSITNTASNTASKPKVKNWINQLNQEDLISIRKLFLFFDELFVSLPEEKINEFIDLNLYKDYIKIINILKLSYL